MIETPNNDNDAVLSDNTVDDPAVFEPDLDDFGPGGLDPDTDEGAETHDDPGDKDPGDNATNTDVESNANEDSGTNWYNLRSNRGRSYGTQLDHQMDDPVSSKSYESGLQMLQRAADKMDELLGTTYTSTFWAYHDLDDPNCSIQKHGQAAVDALLQEFFCQLDRKNVLEPLDASTLTASQKQEALCAVNLIKEKPSGKLKGRTCADGRSQRSKYTKEETTAPTVSSTGSLMFP